MRDPIAVTGMGMVCALGHSRQEISQALRLGKRAFAPVRRFDGSRFRVSLVAETPVLDCTSRFDRHLLRHTSHTDRMALWAASDALAQAQLPSALAHEAGIFVGASTAGMTEIEDAQANHVAPGVAEYISFPVWSTTHILARAFSLAGPRATYMTACSSSAHAIGVAMQRLRRGELTVALAGGAEGLSRLTLAGFGSLGVLDPLGSRPFATDRKGLTLGEGAAFFVLESLSHAQRRDANIIAICAGYGASADAYHVVHPRADGEGAVRAIHAALTDAGVTPSDIDYVNAHGTGTSQNDAMECLALRRVFAQQKLALSSSKSMFGHALGAAAALEFGAVVLGMQDGFVPPNAGTTDAMPELGDLVLLREADPRSSKAAVSTSFGFGGNNAALVILAADERAPVVGHAQTPPTESVLITGAAVHCRRGTAHTPETIIGLLNVNSDTARLDTNAALGPAHARRLDVLSAHIVTLSRLACSSAALTDTRETGIGVGTALGGIDVTAAFLQRLFDKGPQLVNPIDFPNLVHNASAGHASSILGATGDNITASQEELSGDEALQLMFERVAARKLNTTIVLGGDLASPVVDTAYAVIDHATRTSSHHTLVVAGTVLEGEAHCRQRSVKPWARVVATIQACTPTAAIERVLTIAEHALVHVPPIDLWLTGATERFTYDHEATARELEVLRGTKIIAARALLGDAGGAGVAVVALAAAMLQQGVAQVALVTSVTRGGRTHATLLTQAAPSEL